MRSLAYLSTFALLALGFLCGSASGEDARLYLLSTPDGTRMVEELAPDGASTLTPNQIAPVPGTPAVAYRGGDLLWHRNHTDATYTTTAFCRPGGILAAGTYLNPPKQIEVIPIEGDGTPDWTQAGTEFHVDASLDGSVIAAVDFDQNALTVNVHCLAPGSSTPLWSTSISPASRGSERTIQVSDDGSTIAVLVTMQEGNPAARLYLYAPSSPVPIGTFDGPGGFGRNLSLGADGRFAAFIGLATAYVADRDTGVLRGFVNMGASNDPIAISTDGRYLAFGWTSLRMTEWNGAAYVNLWTIPGGAFALKTCTFSADGSTFVAGWYRNTYTQNQIQTFAMPSSTPLWTRLYPQSGGQYQDIPSDVALTPAGDYILVGSWGDQLLMNDEVQLFSRESSTPQMTFDTPGSVFDVDLAWNAEETGLYLTACAKGVHANQNGRGGDLYSIFFGGPASAPEASAEAADLRLTTLPNPFTPGAAFLFTLRRASPVQVSIYSTAGREVRRLAGGSFEAGLHALTWDGRDSGGRGVASGVYWLEVAGDRGRVVGKTVLVR